MSEWISVEDRLPDYDNQITNYLTIDGEGEIDVCYFDENVWYGWQVTHWMPLPEPPEEGADHE